MAGDLDHGGPRETKKSFLETNDLNQSQGMKFLV
jgi:hypothetical protein